jgi:hypothetical protein
MFGRIPVRRLLALPLVVGVVLLLIPAAVGAPPPATVVLHHASLTHGGSARAPGTLGPCSSGITRNRTGYVCVSASSVGANGSARGFDQIQASAASASLSGLHAFYGQGFLHLLPGFASVDLNCTAGSSSWAQVYVYWHVWVFDTTIQSYATQSNSGYIWDSGMVVCNSFGGTIQVGSPALQGGFNSSAYASTGSVSYTFVAGHNYVFTFFLGCTATASTYGSPGDSVSASCNLVAHPTWNTLGVGRILIV